MCSESSHYRKLITLIHWQPSQHTRRTTRRIIVVTSWDDDHQLLTLHTNQRTYMPSLISPFLLIVRVVIVHGTLARVTHAPCRVSEQSGYLLREPLSHWLVCAVSSQSHAHPSAPRRQLRGYRDLRTRTGATSSSAIMSWQDFHAAPLGKANIYWGEALEAACWLMTMPHSGLCNTVIPLADQSLDSITGQRSWPSKLTANPAIVYPNEGARAGPSLKFLISCSFNPIKSRIQFYPRHALQFAASKAALIRKPTSAMSQLRDGVEYTRDWVREPQGRGTLSILYTCTFTLILCVYTAIHLNIPPAGEARIWQFLRKVKWAIVAIFAPEVVLFTAIYQYWSARLFCLEMDEIRAEQGGGDCGQKESMVEEEV